MPEVTLARVLALALPVMASGVLQAMFRPVDQYFVQDLGAPAQGALGVATMVTILVFSAWLVLSAGTAAYVGRHTGAGRWEARRDVVEQALGAGVVLAVVLAVLGWVGSRPLVVALGLEGVAVDHAVAYLQVLFFAGMALTVAPTVDATFHAMGDTRLPLYLQAGAVALNLALTATLVPVLGVAGAAVGTVIAQTLATGVGLVVLQRRLDLRWSRCVPGPTTPGCCAWASRWDWLPRCSASCTS